MLLQRDLDRTMYNQAFKLIKYRISKCHRCVKGFVKLCPKAVNRNFSACVVDFQVCMYYNRIIYSSMLPRYFRSYISSGM
jgi:hypothetical protein